MHFLNDVPRFFSQWLLNAFWLNDSKIARRIRQSVYQTSCNIDTQVMIVNRANFQAGSGSSLYHASYILNTHGQFALGQRSHLGAFCYVNVAYGKVTIGDDVAIGPGTKIIAYSNHYGVGKKVTDERLVADVLIGNNVFVGANCAILPGTRIADHVIVGAGAVVKGELKTDCIYGGIPCRELKRGWYSGELAN